MSELTWEYVERLCFALAGRLMQQGISLERVPLPQSSKQATDEWIRAYLRAGPEFELPTDPLVQRALIARLKSVHDVSRIYKQQGLPFPKSPAAEALEGILIDAWHSTLRAMWFGDASRN